MVSALLVVAASLWLGVEIVSNTTADALADIHPEAALSQSDHPAALVSRARRELAEAGGSQVSDAVSRAAQRALRGDPLEAEALSLLALAAEADGDKGRAESLMQLAGARSRRDTRVQAWLLDRKLDAKEYAGALTHADAILRVRPDARDALLPVLTAFADDPEGRGLLSSLLKRSPPWRSWFLAHLPGESQRPTALYDLYAALETGQAPLTAEEFRP